jgi:Papain-like cysteine protease AvrRpt2
LPTARRELSLDLFGLKDRENMGWTRCPHPQILGEPQNIASMCWFACYTMLFRWNDKPEAEIKPFIWSTLQNAGIDVNGAKRGGLKLADNLKAARALGLGARGFGQPVTEANLRELLALSPVWATGRWFENSNHVYVIVGVSENEVEYYDPWYDVAPDDAFTSHKTSLNWVLNGDGGTRKGLAHTFQWYPLQFIKP